MRGSTMAMLGALSSMLPNLGQEIPDPNLMVLPAKLKNLLVLKLQSVV